MDWAMASAGIALDNARKFRRETGLRLVLGWSMVESINQTNFDTRIFPQLPANQLRRHDPEPLQI
jgi:hypothetical protein